MENVYRQYLDFDKIKRGINKQEKKNAGKDPLNDLSSVSEEAILFFNKLVFSKNTSELAEYSDVSLDHFERILNETAEILTYVKNLINDESFLSQKKERLEQSMKERVFRQNRRIL